LPHIASPVARLSVDDLKWQGRALGTLTGTLAMRGETLETFQRTRNAPGALYSVAGKEAGKLSWDQPGGAPRPS